jgi:hypothetical protein
MTERDLVLAGFQPRGDGSLTSPGRITLTPSGEFYRVSVELPSGEALVCHVSKLALKIQTEKVKP